MEMVGIDFEVVGVGVGVTKSDTLMEGETDGQSGSFEVLSGS